MLPVTPVQNVEGRWCSTSRGVTTKYLWVWHNTTWWIASWWIKTLPRVKWVPTFKVECRILGYVDDLTRQTHGRCYDQRVTVDHGELCLRYGSKTWREVHCVFHMDLQERMYKARFFSERIDYGMTYSIDQTHFFSRSIYRAKNHLYRKCFVQA